MKIALNNQSIQSNSTSYKNNNSYSRMMTSSVNFAGKPPIEEINNSKIFEPVKKFLKPLTDQFKKGMNFVTDSIAKGYASIMRNKKVARLVAWTEDRKIDVIKHTAAGISLIISGMYIKKTLSNKKLDSEKRTTLAVNQGIVSVIATTLGYVVTGALNKKIDKFVRIYSAANIHDKELPVLRKGLGGATAMLVFGLMYRYVAPVLVTPVANSIGNQIQARKEAKAAAKSVVA